MMSTNVSKEKTYLRWSHMDCNYGGGRSLLDQFFRRECSEDAEDEQEQSDGEVSLEGSDESDCSWADSDERGESLADSDESDEGDDCDDSDYILAYTCRL